jgi:hypothetical protein
MHIRIREGLPPSRREAYMGPALALVQLAHDESTANSFVYGVGCLGYISLIPLHT